MSHRGADETAVWSARRSNRTASQNRSRECVIDSRPPGRQTQEKQAFGWFTSGRRPRRTLMSQSEGQTGNSGTYPPAQSSSGCVVWGGLLLWGFFTIPGVWALFGLMTRSWRHDPGAQGPHGSPWLGAIFRMVVLVGSYIISSIIALALPAINSRSEGTNKLRAVVFFPILFNLGELVCVIIVDKVTKH